jgi:hypothetical protein
MLGIQPVIEKLKDHGNSTLELNLLVVIQIWSDRTILLNISSQNLYNTKGSVG